MSFTSDTCTIERKKDRQTDKIKIYGAWYKKSENQT